MRLLYSLGLLLFCFAFVCIFEVSPLLIPEFSISVSVEGSGYIAVTMNCACLRAVFLPSCLNLKAPVINSSVSRVFKWHHLQTLGYSFKGDCIGHAQCLHSFLAYLVISADVTQPTFDYQPVDYLWHSDSLGLWSVVVKWENILTLTWEMDRR